MPLTQGIKHIATKDITVYKIYSKTKKSGIYKSIINRGDSFEYKLGKIYNTGSGEIKDPSVISDGYFHSWISKDTAEKVLTVNADVNIPEKRRINWKEGVVLECIIPKGTLYYEGIAGELSTYASVKIKPIKEVYSLKSQPHIKYREPSEKQVKEYYNKYLAKEYKDPENFDSKREFRARMMWKISDYYFNNKTIKFRKKI